jgi:hypothetical protein
MRLLTIAIIIGCLTWQSPAYARLRSETITPANAATAVLPSFLKTANGSQNVADTRPNPEEDKGFNAVVKTKHADLRKLAHKSEMLVTQVDQFENLLDAVNRGLISEDQQEALVRDVCLIGRYPNGFKEDSGFLEDETAMQVLVEALGSNRNSIKKVTLKPTAEIWPERHTLGFC